MGFWHTIAAELIGVLGALGVVWGVQAVSDWRKQRRWNKEHVTYGKKGGKK